MEFKKAAQIWITVFVLLWIYAIVWQVEYKTMIYIVALVFEYATGIGLILGNRTVERDLKNYEKLKEQEDREYIARLIGRTGLELKRE